MSWRNEKPRWTFEDIAPLLDSVVQETSKKLSEKLNVPVSVTVESSGYGSSASIKFTIDGLEFFPSIHACQQVNRSSSWHYTGLDLYEIRTPSTDYGSKGFRTYTNIPAQTFKQRKKDNGFPVDKLVEKLALIYNHYKRQEDAKQAKNLNAIALADYQRQVWGQQEIPKYDDLKVEVETNPEVPLKVSFSFTECCTPERAVEIRAGLVALGLISEK